MKERPILFSGAMVRAILEGRKTQTRRVINEKQRIGYPASEIPFACAAYFTTDGAGSFGWECPYGVPGDRLWVRETHSILDMRPNITDVPESVRPVDRCPVSVTYAADDDQLAFVIDPADWRESFDTDRVLWRPSIFLPRWASRLTLDVVSVRVERVQEISEADAIAEGIGVGERASDPDASTNVCVNCQQHRNRHVGVARVCFGSCGELFSTSTYRGGFSFLWQQINGKREGCAWPDNPYVWVVEFSLPTPPNPQEDAAPTKAYL